eukprot:TRINITY_DN64899_c0_g1_i1.p1 TRINITY_DN64899_c0_g1~~TRINITY_DN64899_c0_g1_i1.p1  ORF type:complete len:1056 (+),score=326.72 TRINITY_DN64899_c0_g1_i1:79-3168(+)
MGDGVPPPSARAGRLSGATRSSAERSVELPPLPAAAVTDPGPARPGAKAHEGRISVLCTPSTPDAARHADTRVVRETCTRRKRGVWRRRDDTDHGGRSAEAFTTSIHHGSEVSLARIGPSSARPHCAVWMESCLYERAAFSSTIAAAELLYADVLRATEHIAEPNVLRTSCCFLIFREIAELFGRYRSMLTVLGDELEKAVYLPPGHRMSVTAQRLKDQRALAARSKGKRKKSLLLPDESTLCCPSRACAKELAASRPMVRAVLDSGEMRTTYFEAFESVRQRITFFEEKARYVEDHIQRQVKVLNLAVASWQASYKGKVFLGWRRYVLSQKGLRAKYRAMFLGMVSKGRIHNAWRNWEQHVDRVKLRAATEHAGAAAYATTGLLEQQHDIGVQHKAVADRVAGEESVLSSALAANQKAAAEVAEVEAVIEATKKEQAEYSNLVLDIIEDVAVNRAVRSQQAQLTSLLKQWPDPDLYFLNAWANELIAQRRRGPMFPLRCRFGSDENTRGILPYAYLLQAINPTVCGDDWLSTVEAIDSPEGRALEVIHVTREKLGLLCPFQPADLTGQTKAFQHLFLAQTFALFGDLRNSAGPGPRPVAEGEIENTPAFSEHGGVPSDPSAHGFRADTAVLLETPWAGAPRQQRREDFEYNEQWKLISELRNGWETRTAGVTAGAEAAVAAIARKGPVKEVLSAKQRQDRAQCTRVPASAITAVLQLLDPVAVLAVQEKLTGVLEKHYAVLERVFRFYGEPSGSSSRAQTPAQDGRTPPSPQAGQRDKPVTLRFGGLQRLAADCGIVCRKVCGVTRGQLQEIFMAAMGNNLPASAAPEASSPTARPVRVDQSWGLKPEEFSVAVCHLAHRCVATGPSFPDRVATFIQQELEPKAAGGDSDSFRESVYTAAMQQALRSHSEQLQKIFCHYQAPKQSESQETVVDLEGWRGLAKQCNLLDSSFMDGDLVQVYNSVQGVQDTADAAGMSYTEFCEAVVAVASWKLPCPFDPLPQRVATFIHRGLFGALGGKGRSSPSPHSL